MKESKVIFDAKKLAAEMMKNLSAEQTNRLIEYAKQTILEIGNKIQTYHSRNHMYRSGHLLRSLCCGVSYDGKLVYSGFYGDIALKAHNTWWEENTTNSYLHEWIPEYEAFQIDGRQMAQNYIQRYGSAGSGNKTWRVFFAILAPYWGYWESGFTHIKTGRRMQFQVMTHIFDDVRMDLKPAKTHLTVYVPKYSYKNPKYKKKKGIKKIGIIR